MQELVKLSLISGSRSTGRDTRGCITPAAPATTALLTAPTRKKIYSNSLPPPQRSTSILSSRPCSPALIYNDLQVLPPRSPHHAEGSARLRPTGSLCPAWWRQRHHAMLQHVQWCDSQPNSLTVYYDHYSQLLNDLLKRSMTFAIFHSKNVFESGHRQIQQNKRDISNIIKSNSCCYILIRSSCATITAYSVYTEPLKSKL